MLPEKVVVIELEPATSEVPFTLAEQVPALSVQLPMEVVPALKVAVPMIVGALPVKPAGVPPVTVAVSVVD